MRISDWSSDGCSYDLILTLGDRTTGLRTRAGWSDKFDAIASNADIMHSYRDLLSHTVRGRRQTEILERKRWSPSLFLVHFRSEEHTSELQSLMRISYAVFCLKKKTLQSTPTLFY